MGFKPWTGFEVICDRCGNGRHFAPDDLFDSALVETEQEGRDLVEASQSEIDADGRITCFPCLEDAIRADLERFRASLSTEGDGEA